MQKRMIPYEIKYKYKRYSLNIFFKKHISMHKNNTKLSPASINWVGILLAVTIILSILFVYMTDIFELVILP